MNLLNSNIYWALINLSGTVLNANAAAQRWKRGERKLAVLSMAISVTQSVLMAQNVAAVVNELTEVEEDEETLTDEGETLISYPA